MNRCRRLSWWLPLLLAGAAPAAAQVNDALVACAVEPDDAARLACYDNAVAGLSAEARAIGEKRAAATAVLVRQRAEAKAAADAKAAKEAFGADRINRNLDHPEQLKELDAGVSEMLTAADGRAVLLLDNGQLWRQESGVPLPPVRAGDHVKVERSRFGSYMLTLTKQNRSFNARRLR